MSGVGDPFGDSRRLSYADSRASETLLPSPPGSSTSTLSMFSSGPPSSTASSSRESSSASTLSASAGGMTALTPNGKYYNPVVMSFIRDDWIQQQLHLRQSAYTAFEKTSIATGTWNVNAKKPPLAQADEVAKLLQWLLPQPSLPQQTAAIVFPDIIALGFQEIVDLNAVNVVVNSTVSAQRSALWEDAVLSALNSQSPAHQYKVVMEKHLVGILLLVFVRVEHVEHIKEVRGATAGVGIMGVMGNKGGAAIRMRYYDSTLCFVCAHLAAHRENVTGRNADYLNILSKIDFRENDSDVCFSDVRQLTGEPAILSHDFVFWLGDLNYRITEELSVETVFHHAESGVFKELLMLDQLNIERMRGNVFRGFDEGPITFPPTYKFQAGTMVYEKRPEKKLRAPAWCDRILWRAKDADQITQQRYGAVLALMLSDHKPVHAAFDVQIRHQVEAKKAQVVRDIMLQLDKWENENMPKVRLLQRDGVHASTGVLGFAHLKYGLDQTQTIVIENTGVVVAHFRFIPKLDDVVLCKPWLSIAPTFGMIPPKERVAIRITAHVDESVAHGLSSGTESLDDTLILRVESGRDYFLVLSGQYDNSCFGNSLEQLVLSAEPVRHVSQQHVPGTAVFSASGSTPSSPSSSGASTGAGRDNAQRIPKELWRMANDIYQHYLDERNLFVEGGDKRELALLREALDTGSAFPDHSGYSTAELLLSWLQSLRQSVVPDAVLARALECGNGNLAQTCRALLDALPPVRFNVLVYIVSFLKEVLKHHATNKLTPETLAFVFSRCLVSQYRAPRALTHMRVTSSSSSAESASGASSLTATAATGGGSTSAAGGGSTATGSNATSTANSNQSSVLPEETLRRSAREVEVAQWNAAQRAEKMEKMMLYLLTTTTL